MKFDLLVFVLMSFVLNACCGQLSGDPAPAGPGPPTELKTTASQLSSDIKTSTTPYLHVTNSKQLDLKADADTIDDVQYDNRFSQEKDEKQKQSQSPPLLSPSSSNDSVIKNRHREHIRKSHGNSDNTHHKLNEKLGKTTIKAATASSTKAIYSTEANLDKLPNEFVKLPENQFRLNQKPCKNLSVDDYLKMKGHPYKIINIDHLEQNATLVTSASSSTHPNHIPSISIDVKHDLFDANYGLVRNVIYTVHVKLSKNESIDDFYMEAIIDGMHKGVFRSDTPMNWHRKHKQHHSNYNGDNKDGFLNENRKLFSNHFMENNVSSSMKKIRFDESGIEIPNSNVGQHMTASNPPINSSISIGRRNKRMKMNNHMVVDHCSQEFWSENVIESSRTSQLNVVRKWSYSIADLKNKTVSFRLLFRRKSSFDVYETTAIFNLSNDCILYMKDTIGNVDYTALPEQQYDKCIIFFPSREPINSESPGLLIEIKRLNIPCDTGSYITLSDYDKLCGKLEDITPNERVYYFPLQQNMSVKFERNPVFSLNFKLVDYCYNVTMTTRNNSFLLEPKHNLECYFLVHLPYGNQIELNLFQNFYTKSMKNGSSIVERRLNQDKYTSIDDIDYEYVDLMLSQYVENVNFCVGVAISITDANEMKWSHCINSDSRPKKFSFKSTGNSMLIHVARILYLGGGANIDGEGGILRDDINNQNTADNIYDRPSLYIQYTALPVSEIVSQCAFGWISVNQFCISAIELMLSWKDAESHCQTLGGHLASIKSEREQKIIDTLLMNSATFRSNVAYWIGASDEIFEGDFRWSNGYPYTFSNWFPGWPEHNGYNKQPNDDGLSAQDCVELRRYFRIPPAIQAKMKIVPVTLTYMWNDRDCNEKNYFLCERPLSDEPIEKSWSTDCNKTIILSHNHLRASIWSPGFPTHYPDKTNCFTVIIAPKGFYIAIEFEEFVLENEPQCSYDYLEIIDSHPSDHNGYTVNASYTKSGISDIGRHHTQRTENGAKHNETNFIKNVDIFDNFLSIYKSHHSYLIQTPEMGINFDKSLNVNAPRRICGDWNSKVKLLRYRSSGPILGLHFSSDYSHHFGGYKAKVVIKNAASKCSDDRLKSFNGTCYLFVSYPEVDWFTAHQVCAGIHGELASVSTAEEQRFITTNIRNELDYSPQTIYWLGGKFESNKHLKWNDGSNITYKGWIQGQRHAEKTSKEALCLGLQWKVSSTPMLPSGLFWSSDHCTKFGGYVCKRRSQDNLEVNFENQTVTGTEGLLTSPNYPNLYPANTNYYVKLIGPENTRLVLEFSKIDLEEQNDCLYDYISIEDDESYERNFESVLTAKSMAMLTPDNDRNYLTDEYMMDAAARDSDDANDENKVRRKKRNSNLQMKKSSVFKRIAIEPSFFPYVRWCGTHESNMSRFDFISATNTVLIYFHSDYSVSGSGFSLAWKAVSMSGCPTQTYTSSDDANYIKTPNFPNVLLNHLDCKYVIFAANNKRIWLEFQSFDLIRDATVEIDLGKGPFVPFRNTQQLNDGVFVSYQNRVTIHLRTGDKPKGTGFHLAYKTMGIREQRHTILQNKANGVLYHLNYPQPQPSNIDFTQHIVAPLGEVILLEVHNVGISEADCHDTNRIEIYDNYADINGSFWNLCKLSALDDNYRGDAVLLPSPIHITSYLNTINIRQKTTDLINLNLNASIRIQPDFNYKYKLATGNDEVEACHPNPCKNDGKCISNGSVNRCQCVGHFTGRFCALTICEMEPCIFGKCELTSTSFKCHCLQGYMGQTCNQKQKPCMDNPCESRGECFEKNGKFQCRCHAWWEGTRCERRMMHIPYKPLSERMLQEPFWLGLITVFVVLAFIGLVWCAKRHFPEKIEKLLAEEADRNRPGSIHHLHNHHHPSLREQLHFNITNSAPQSTATTPGTARTIFGRLGIRKPSILSLSSPHAHAHAGGETARTFSLDDLLRPPARRTPSPARKKRNNSTPTKTRAANEKRLILETLIAPATIDTSNRPKMSLDDLAMLYEQRSQRYADGLLNSDGTEVWHFDEASTAKRQTISVADAKNEKRVTFARLLSRVSAELSSESTSNLKALNLPVGSSTELIPRPSSVPPTPSANDSRSPHGSCSNQGSESLSGSELTINDVGLRNMRRIKPKVSSADSILAMFRNFTSTNVLSQMPSSLIISPSTTPSASSPQDINDDSSSTSSMHTPISYTSCAPDSPISYHLPSNSISIEVPVLDPLNAHKSTTNNANNNSLNPPTILLEVPSSNTNKCLSPIRELPTPIPSPALTPIMSRPQRFSGFLHNDQHFSNNFSDDDEKLSVEHIENRGFMKVIVNERNACTADVPIPNKHTPPLLRPIPKRPTVTLDTNILIDIEPPTPEQRSPKSPNRPKNLIIPQLVVQQASPTKEHRISVKLLGSPPPQRANPSDIQIFVTSESPDQSTQNIPTFNVNKPPATFELPFSPPTITINAIMTEMESDTDTMSPANIKCPTQLGLPRNDMCYLSPFSSVSRGDRTISESNLSSSGYSSMASPAGSRCNSSSNPLHLDMDDGSSGSNTKFRKMRSNSMQNGKSGDSSYGNCSSGSGAADQYGRNKTRSDSETLSDDVLLESNDEGIGTDHIEEKHDASEAVNAKELEHFIEKELLDSGKKIMFEEPTMSQLQLPTIVIQSEGNDKVSPVSSRSESPISERTGANRFSPLFYNRKEQQILPFTDSDGLYDFPSSDGKGHSNALCKKSNMRKRERKLSRGVPIALSPTKANSTDFLQRETTTMSNPSQQSMQMFQVRKSPKKRPLKRYTMVSSSSSSESLTDTKARFGLYLKGKSLKRTENDIEKDATKTMQHEVPPVARPCRKINRLRAIGNQIRFLRRLQHSLRARARNQHDCISSHSCTDDDDIDDSIPDSDNLTQTVKLNNKSNDIDVDSVATQSKSTESYSPPNVIHATKTTRSLSLNASQGHFIRTKEARTDAYLDEVNSN
ncbi:uncharacterized protein LOC116346788 isoform X2 [Contarinia nasturtii]|uniref:uncharacterized protein LOC116346788 isoform X2 n=1 Tax=Contarinia nasturtii TaxID=265458 RepID=UPI0012D495EC|nr:uncharacterized protein LOC116346788 isoform X2 [Contarinia nasturtii]